jgi:hypothetical protein
MVGRAYGPDQVPDGDDGVRELGPGWFNVAYRIRLRAGDEVVLKIAPPPDVEVMTYEHGAMATESGRSPGPALTALGAETGTRGLTRDYTIVLLSGALVSTGFSSLVRAEGRLRFSTLLWVVPVLVQITLDPLLIFGLGWGARGVAARAGTAGVWAALALGEIISALAALVLLRRLPPGG